MNKADRRLPEPNPYSTRFVRPGALPYLFPAGASMEQLLDRLEASGGWGQIIGPHGSGKSTLLAALLPELERRGRAPYVITLRDGRTRAAWRAIPSGAGVVVLDGFEQLGRWGRLLLRRRCRHLGLGLIVTAHESVGLPDLYQTTQTPESAWRVVCRLAPSTVEGPETIAERLDHHGGNLREVLFELYDRFEQRRRSAQAGPTSPPSSAEAPGPDPSPPARTGQSP